MEKPVSVLIHGAGAVGATIGWRIAQSSRANVTTVCRTNYDAVKQSGFNLRTSHWGNGSYRPDHVLRNTHEGARKHYDYVVVATKNVTDPRGLVKDLAPVISSETTICSAQNGVGSDPVFAEAFPGNPVLSLVTFVSLTQSVPGKVEQAPGILCGPHPFALGAYAGGDKAETAMQRLVSIDPTFGRLESAETTRWEKMVFNAAWNPSCTLFGLDSSQMVQNPVAMALVTSLATETLKIAQMSGIDLDDGVVDRTVGWGYKNAHLPLVPSMLQDLRHKKPMEVEGICGVLIRKAAAVGAHAPMMTIVERRLSERNEEFSAESKNRKTEEAEPHFNINHALGNLMPALDRGPFVQPLSPVPV